MGRGRGSAAPGKVSEEGAFREDSGHLRNHSERSRDSWRGKGQGEWVWRSEAGRKEKGQRRKTMRRDTTF